MRVIILASLLLVGCASQPQYAVHRYIHSDGRVSEYVYRVPSTPGYVTDSSTTIYRDANGARIGSGTTTGPMR